MSASASNGARRPVPEPDAVSAPYWEATVEGRLILQWCSRCEQSQFYPRPVCVRCGEVPEWREASGLGSVYSFSIVRQSRTPPFDTLAPYVLAIVETDEGPRMTTNIVGCDPDDVTIGQRVAVEFERLSDTAAVPLWRPVAANEDVIRH